MYNLQDLMTAWESIQNSIIAQYELIVWILFKTAPGEESLLFLNLVKQDVYLLYPAIVMRSYIALETNSIGKRDEKKWKGAGSGKK